MINMNELKNLNAKDPGSWPWLVKIASFVFMFVIVAVGAYFLTWEEQLAELESVRLEEGTLKEAFLKKKEVAINLDLIKKQLSETQESFGALLKQLPSKSEMDALLTDINQAGLGHGLQFESFRPNAEVVNGAFAEQPISIRVTGTYDDFGRFSSDISVLPRIVTLTDISITPVSGNILAMDTTAKTFRYLDEAESAGANAAGAKK